ncbi:MAG: hypothetical protein CMJ83_07380 [Planctomycetes bacterium]|nr:hypothetical protein [Planctomycetota bacterium]
MTKNRAATKRGARKTTKKKASGSRADTVAWAARLMKKKPDISMTELKKLGSKDGHKVYPLILGLARKELGWGRPKKKAARKKTPATAPARRGPGRPRKSTDPAVAITAILTHVKELERERDMLRKAISKIAGIVEGV